MRRDRFFRELAPFFLKNCGFVVDKNHDTSASVGATSAFTVMRGLTRIDEVQWTDEATKRMEAAVDIGLTVATNTIHGDPKAFLEELRKRGFDIVSRGDHGIVIDQNYPTKELT